MSPQLLPELPRVKAGQTILVTGPARSGKSEWAEALAQQWQQQSVPPNQQHHRETHQPDLSPAPQVCYIATAQLRADDAEWTQRIQAHRRRRPPEWQLEEIPIELAPRLEQATCNQCLLIDSLGTWLANTIDWEEDVWRSHLQTFLQALERCPALIILVAEETGWGVVPAYELGRVFRDRLGVTSRRIGQRADRSYLTVAGHALPLHQLGYRLP